jgi:hypothetical protein
MVVTDISNPYAAPTEESSQWSLTMKDLKMRSSPEQASGREYDVGYRKPPKHKQFKLGQSGNPRGRPKGSKNESTIPARDPSSENQDPGWRAIAAGHDS